MDGARDVDVVVVGAGLAGLTAAAFAARGGASVVVLDARSAIGGRGRTVTTDGFHLNEGPHALYRNGAGSAALRELGIRPSGRAPRVRGTRFSLDGRLVSVPPARSVRQVTGMLARLGRDAADPAWVDASAQEWIEARTGDPVARQLAATLVRVSSYSSGLDTFSADAAIDQLRSGAHGVTYLHGGWAQLVDALERVATVAGVAIRRSVKVGTVVADGHRWVVRPAGVGQGGADGGDIVARSVVLAAGGPGLASRLVSGSSATLADAAADARPVYAACLDLGLARLPVPSRTAVFGIDRPTYASTHSRAARLVDGVGEVLHVARYEPDPDDDAAADVERIADEIQPGWRDVAEVRRLGARLVVAHDRPQPGRGLRGRPSCRVPELDGILVAGDWVGPDDLIGGAALASGRAAGEAAARAAAGIVDRHRYRRDDVGATVSG